MNSTSNKFTLRYIAYARLPTEKAHGIQIMSMCEAFARQGVRVELVIPARPNPIIEDPFSYYGISKNFTIRSLPIKPFNFFRDFLGPIPFWIERFRFSKAVNALATAKPATWYYYRDEFSFILNTKPDQSIFEAHIVPKQLWLYKKALNHAKLLVAITHSIARELGAAKGTKDEQWLIAPDGVDIARFTPTLDQATARSRHNLDANTPVVLYTGQLYPWKGVNTLVKAGTFLPQTISLIIVGGQPDHITILKGLVTPNGARTEFIGQVKYEYIPDYLAAADIIVIPNSGKYIISEKYTSPLKLFEAMAAGKAIIASDLPSLREILDPTTAVLVPADNPSALAAAISELISNPLKRQTLGVAAQKKVQAFDWQVRAQHIIEKILV